MNKKKISCKTSLVSSFISLSRCTHVKIEVKPLIFHRPFSFLNNENCLRTDTEICVYLRYIVILRRSKDCQAKDCRIVQHKNIVVLTKPKNYFKINCPE